LAFDIDPTYDGENSVRRNFYDQLADDGHYHLLQVEADGQPFTSDDIVDD
jgi:hypothetical protein|tara:strand:+ start:866 stop:1015 length:150 start_codon:yes stop_codon:yes gene_type:complete